MSNIKKNTNQKIKNMVVIALFCAIAFSVSFVFKINIGFRSFDAKDAIVTICGLYFGPVAALLSSLLVSVFESLYSGTGIWGWVMDFASTAIFSCTAAIIYKYKRDMLGAIIGIISAIFTTTAFMMPLNILVVPMYVSGTSMSAVAEQIPMVLLPFNAAKSIFNAALVLFIYKPVSTALKAAKVIKSSDEKKSKGFAIRQMFITLGIGLVLIICAVAVIVWLGGDVSWLNFGK